MGAEKGIVVLGETLFDSLRRAGEAQGWDASLDAQIDRLEARYGASATRFDGPVGTEATAARRAIAEVADAESALVEAEERMPDARARFARARRGSYGPWILLGVVGVIILAIVIGQLVY